MTIEEAIRHCMDEAGKNRARAVECANAYDGEGATRCHECANEHQQLAAWLEELQEKRCKVIVQANRIKELEGEFKEELAKWLEKLQQHGRWIPTEYDGYADGKPVYDAFECSECGHEHRGEEDTLTAFCPDCGARMDLTEAAKQENPQKACTTCGKRTLCPGPASGRPRTGCSFWTAEEVLR